MFAHERPWLGSWIATDRSCARALSSYSDFAQISGCCASKTHFLSTTQGYSAVLRHE